MKNYLFIHGAFASKHSFNYIEHKIGALGKLWVCQHLEYDSHTENVFDIVERGKEILNDNNFEITIVGHSLGGLIALSLASEKNVKKVVTISSPLSGIDISPLFAPYLLINCPLLVDVLPQSKFIRDIKRKDFNIPINVISTEVNFYPVIPEPSDGVVTVKSQTSWVPKDATIDIINASHHEVLQMPEIIDKIRA